MAFQLTQNARQAIGQTNLRPQIVFAIDGLDSAFTTAGIYKYIRIGDPGLEIGNVYGEPWYIGGFSLVEGQAQYLSMDKGGIAKITQSLNPSRGSGTTVSRMVVPVIDKNGEISKLISPGFELEDVLGRRCKVLLGFANTAYPEDYIEILVAQIESIESSPGLVNFIVVSPEEKKRQLIFPQGKTKLASTISTLTGLGSITLDDTSIFPTRVLGPDGTYDSTIEFYVKIDDEVMKYSHTSGSTLVTLTRAQYGTEAATHEIGTNVESFIRLNDNGINLALKLMLSGWGGPFVNLSANKFNFGSGPGLIPKAIYFAEDSLIRDHNIQVGDWVTITGAINAGNNQTLQITSVVEENNGSYCTVNGTLINEVDSTASVAFRSQYDVYKQGCRMFPNEVDIDRHIELFELFLSSFEMDFIVEQVGQFRDFLEKQIYLPMACFSVPRKGRASVSYHIGPIPGQNLQTINYETVLNADKLVLRRGLSENFFNEVEFSWQSNPSTGKLDVSRVFESAASKAKIPVGNKSFKIESSGLSEASQGLSLATQAADRLLKRYAFGAEYIKGIQVHGSIGIPIEIGDIVLFDYESLKVTDTTQGTRGGKVKLMEVQNKIQDNRTGIVTLDLVNTSFGVEDRYGLISPCSKIKSAVSASQFVIEQSFRMAIPEGQKWEEFVGAAVVVRSVNYSTSSTSFIGSVVGDTITLTAPLSFTPTAGMLMELDIYDNQPTKVKLYFGFMSDGDNDFADGEPPYVQL
jgi:hypothetical protein